MQHVRKALYGITDPQPANVLVLLPKDLKEAVRIVLTQEIGAVVKSKRFTKIRDTLEDEHSELKNLWWPLKYAKETQRYELIPSVTRLCIVRSEIDPFERFYNSHRIESMTHLRDQYYDRGGKCTWDLVTPAIAPYHACHKAKCVNCFARSIRWNGYSDDALCRDCKKLICENCGSVYEIMILFSHQRRLCRTTLSILGCLVACFIAITHSKRNFGESLMPSNMLRW
jgi:hypothetical protein